MTSPLPSITMERTWMRLGTDTSNIDYADIFSHIR